MTRRALRSCVLGSLLGQLALASGCALPSTTLGRWNDDEGRPGSDDEDAPADDDGSGGTADGDDATSDGNPGGAHQSCPALAFEFAECPSIAESPEDAWDATVEWTYGDGRGIAVAPLVGPLAGPGADVDGPPDILVVIGDEPDAEPCALERVRSPGIAERIGELDVACRVAPAFGDIDADCIAEIVAVVPVDAGARLAAFEPDGHVDWIATGDLLEGDPIGAVALHDLDRDGRTEVLFAGTVYDHTGEAQWSFGDPSDGHDTPYAVDLQGDAALEIVAAHGVWTHDGVELLALESFGAGARVSVIDSERDGDPELWVQTSAGLLVVDPSTGDLLGTHAGEWDDHDVVTGVVDDLDGDGWPELLGMWKGAAGTSAVAVMWWPKPADRAVAPIWADLGAYVDGQPTAFDLDADGRSEAIVTNATGLVVVDGPFDVIPLEVAVTPSRGPHVAPVVADVDDDGSAEILVVSEQGPALVVVGHASDEWATARPLWNQFASNVTNVGHDGSIPITVVPNWSELNTFGTNARIDDGRLCTRAGPS